MEESKSPAKLGKLSQARGTKISAKEKSSKDAHMQREEPTSTTRRPGNLHPVKEEHNPGSSGAGKMRGRTSRLTRLTGRTNFGESSKGKAASTHQQQVPEALDSQGSYSTDSSPSANRESSSPVVPGMTEKGLRQGWLASAWPNAAVLLSAGLTSGPPLCGSVEEEAEEEPMVEEGSITEQQLGLRQAEERLYRDYIHRLLKVRKRAQALRRANPNPGIKSHSFFPSCTFSAVPRVSKLPVFMQALFRAHREHPGSTQAHQGEETQEKHHGGGFDVASVTILLLLCRRVSFVAFVLQEKQEENELRALPPASAAHLRALDVSIQRTARQHGISQEDLQVRKAVVTRMEEVIRRHLPGVLRLEA